MKHKNLLKIVMTMFAIVFATFSMKSQTLTTGDIAIIGVGVDDEEILLVALADIPPGESVFFSDEEWAGSAFNSGEGFYEWVTPTITAGNTILLTTTSSSAGGTVTQRAGSFALGNSGDGVFIYQTSTNIYNTGTYTILGFAGKDSGDAGTLTGTGLTLGINAIYFGGDNGMYNDVRTTNDKNGHLANIYDATKWSTSGTAQTFDTTNFAMTGAGPGISLGAVSGNTNESGTTATFTVVLTAQPTTDVVLTVLSADTGEVTVAPATLTFTNANWDTPQTVTVTGVDDAIQDGSIEVTITVSVDDANSDDAYDAVADVTTTISNEDDELPNLVINEFLADPDATNGDANGDGTVSTTEDEFIEIYNASGGELNISGYTIEDGNGLRHTFPKGTILPTAKTIVVFGGGTPTGIPSLTQVSSVGFLGLNNGGDTITIKDANGITVTSYTFGGEGGNNIALARDVDITGSFVTHNNVTGNGGVLFSPGRDNTDNIGFYKTWSGATNNDWATATNWIDSNNPSAASDCVLIPTGLTNYPTASSSVTVNSVIINSGASLIANNTFNGSVTVKRTLATNNWYLLAMPVSGESITDMIANNDFDNTTGTGANIGLSFYDNNQVSNQWTYATAASTGSFFETGYSAKFNNPGTITAVGNMRTTNVNVSLTNGTATGFNLIGNIYPSYLAANSNADATNNLLSVNSSKLTETTLWFWNQATSSYDQINQASSAFQVAPSQGFFVQVSSNQSFSFTEAMQSHQSTDSFQKSASSTSKIELLLNDGTLSRKTEIYYIDNTTTGFDNGYDSSIFGGAAHEFTIFTALLSENTGKKLGIQSLPNSDFENMVVPIGIKAAVGKEITFSAEAMNIPDGINVYLEDRTANTVTLLSETNATYKVTLAESLDGIGRFYLHTKSSGVLSTTEVALNNISIYSPTKSTLRITGVSQGKASVKIYSLLGKQVFANAYNTTGIIDVSLSKLATGLYVVQLETEKGILNKKITLE